MDQIKIVGAGISGLSAAITLARNGKKVRIFEQRKDVGSNFKCTVHSVKNYGNWFNEDVISFFKNRLQLNIANSYMPAGTFIKVSPSNYEVESTNKDKNILYNFLRGSAEGSLDRELMEQAQKLGVEFSFQTKIDEKDCDIIATGAKYSDFAGYGLCYENTDYKFGSKTVVFFNNDFAPKGYAYIVPFKDKYITAAVFIKSETKSSAKFYFEKFLKYLKGTKYNFSGEVISEDGGVGYYNLYDSWTLDNAYYIGVAGGLMTADYGFALTNCLFSGHLAATAIINGENYDQLVKSTIYPELVNAYAKRLKIDKMTNEDYDKKFSMAKSSVQIVDYGEGYFKPGILTNLLSAYSIRTKIKNQPLN